MCDPSRGGHSMVGCKCPCCEEHRLRGRLAKRPHVPGSRLVLSVVAADRVRVDRLTKRLGCTKSVAVRLAVRHYGEATA